MYYFTRQAQKIPFTAILTWFLILGKIQDGGQDGDHCCWRHGPPAVPTPIKYWAFSLPWRAAMLIYWNKRKYLHEKRVQLPEDFFGTPTWPPFHCFGTPIWPPWRHVKTLYTSSCWEDQRLSTEDKIVSKYCNMSKTLGRGSIHSLPPSASAGYEFASTSEG